MEVLGESDEDAGDEWVTDSIDGSFATCILVQSMTGSRSFRTMRLVGQAQRKSLHILMDIGITHYFLDLEYAKSLGCNLTQIQPQIVTVADGNNIPCQFRCENFAWGINVHEFRNNVLLINIGSCDMVLGIEWFKQWGKINWDFNKMTMRFQVIGVPICLKGVTHNNNSYFVEVQLHRIKLRIPFSFVSCMLREADHPYWALNHQRLQHHKPL